MLTCHYYKALRIIVLVLIILLLCACTNQTNDNSNNITQDNTLYSAILNIIQADIVPGDNLPLSISYSNAVYSSISFTILSQSDDHGRANVDFTYVDVLALVDGYTGTLEDVDSFYEYCIDAILSKRVTRLKEISAVSYSVIIENNEKRYVIDDIENLPNILTGGMFSVLENALNEVEQ